MGSPKNLPFDDIELFAEVDEYADGLARISFSHTAGTPLVVMAILDPDPTMPGSYASVGMGLTQLVKLHKAVNEAIKRVSRFDDAR